VLVLIGVDSGARAALARASKSRLSEDVDFLS